MSGILPCLGGGSDRPKQGDFPLSQSEALPDDGQKRGGLYEGSLYNIAEGQQR